MTESCRESKRVTERKIKKEEGEALGNNDPLSINIKGYVTISHLFLKKKKKELICVAFCVVISCTERYELKTGHKVTKFSLLLLTSTAYNSEISLIVILHGFIKYTKGSIQKKHKKETPDFSLNQLTQAWLIDEATDNNCSSELVVL